MNIWHMLWVHVYVMSQGGPGHPISIPKITTCMNTDSKNMDVNIYIVIWSFIHYGIVHPFVGIDNSNCQYQVDGFACLPEFKFRYYLYKDKDFV